MRQAGVGVQHLRRPAAHNRRAQTFKPPRASRRGLLGEAAEVSPNPQSGVLFSDVLNADYCQSFPGGTRVLGCNFHSSRRSVAHAEAEVPLAGRQDVNAAGWVMLI